MKTYKDLNNNIWAYEEDGSQDSIIPSEFIQITDEEANVIRAEQEAIMLANMPVVPKPTAEELMAQLLAIQEQIKALGVV
jgi:hypothetical protein